jgi:hypothetical protein
MTTQEAALPVLGMFPFHTFPDTIDKSDPDRAFIVDVAGGRGQSLLQVKKEIEEHGGAGLGKAILQDRERVLDSIPQDQLPGIEKVVIDFFTPQPIKSTLFPLLPFPLFAIFEFCEMNNADCHGRRTYLLPPPHHAQLAGQRSAHHPSEYR